MHPDDTVDRTILDDVMGIIQSTRCQFYTLSEGLPTLQRTDFADANVRTRRSGDAYHLTAKRAERNVFRQDPVGKASLKPMLDLRDLDRGTDGKLLFSRKTRIEHCGDLGREVFEPVHLVCPILANPEKTCDLLHRETETDETIDGFCYFESRMILAVEVRCS